MIRFAVMMLIALLTTVLHASPRGFVLSSQPGWRQGLATVFDDLAVRPLADFVYDAYFTTPQRGGFQLATLPDRVVVQGAVFYEFETDSGRLIRRYPALDTGYDSWAFHGVAVDVQSAATMGLPPGYYGSVVCQPGGELSYLCGVTPAPFPGYTSHGELSEQHVLLRRGLDPGDTALSLVKLFDPDAAGGSLFGQRFTAIDPEQKRFRFWLQGSDPGQPRYLQKLTSARITGAAVDDETIEREWAFSDLGPPESIRTTTSFSFDRVSRSLWRIDHYAAIGKVRVVSESLDGRAEWTLTAASSSSFDAIAAPLTSSPALNIQLIPAVADAPGANGTYWRSDAWFFNPSLDATEIDLQRVSRKDSTRVTLGARQSLEIRNILQHLGGGAAGDGTVTDAVLVSSPYRVGAQLVVSSRTWTPAIGGGSYGQAIQAVPTEVGYSNHLAVTTSRADLPTTPATLTLDWRVPGQFRHNVGIVNVDDDELLMTFKLTEGASRPDGARLDVDVTIPPHSLRQINVESLFPKEVMGERPPYITVYGDKPAAMWLSMVDNRSGDAAFVPFTLFGLEAGPTSRLALPGVAHVPGANMTEWRTDVYGVFSFNATGGLNQLPAANFYPSTPGCSGALSTRPLSPSKSGRFSDAWELYWLTLYADVARQFCPDTDALGALEVQTGSWMTMFSRTYTTRADGSTFGEMLPLYPPRGWHERHFAGIRLSPEARVNIGLYNGADQASRIRVELYHADGSLAAETMIPLAPRASQQTPLRQLFSAVVPDGLYGMSFTTMEGAGCWPYISIVDQQTGDPTNWW